MKHPLFAVATLSAATLLAASAAPTSAARPKDVVAATFPAADWARQIVGSHSNDVRVCLLQKGGADLHSYRPSAADVARILRCDLFIHVGGESDGWAEPLVERKKKAGQGVLNFMETLRDSVKAEEVVEGMQDEDDHDHDHDHAHDKADRHDHDDDHDHEHEEVENDEHVWLSLRFAVRLVDAMAAQIAALDPAHAADYRANAAAYAAKLRELDARYAQTVAKAARKTVLFADRFPFRYLVEDYGLKYYAAFVGCSAESEASFKTVAFLAAKVDELRLPCVLTLEGSGKKIAETVLRVSRAKGVRIRAVDSLQAGAPRDYLAAMSANLAVFADALN